MSGIKPVVIIKGVLELAASAGTGIVVGNLVKATTPDDISRFQKIMVGIGGYTIGAVLSDLSAKHVAGQVDNYNQKLHAILHPEEPALAPEDVADIIVAAGKVVAENGKAVVHDAAEAIEESAGKVADKTEPKPDNTKNTEDTK